MAALFTVYREKNVQGCQALKLQELLTAFVQQELNSEYEFTAFITCYCSYCSYMNLIKLCKFHLVISM